MLKFVECYDHERFSFGLGGKEEVTFFQDRDLIFFDFLKRNVCFLDRGILKHRGVLQGYFKPWKK